MGAKSHLSPECIGKAPDNLSLIRGSNKFRLRDERWSTSAPA